MFTWKSWKKMPAPLEPEFVGQRSDDMWFSVLIGKDEARARTRFESYLNPKCTCTKGNFPCAYHKSKEWLTHQIKLICDKCEEQAELPVKLEGKVCNRSMSDGTKCPGTLMTVEELRKKESAADHGQT
jgi:hypothetical protein